jgi:hypothetical protein
VEGFPELVAAIAEAWGFVALEKSKAHDSYAFVKSAPHAFGT